MKRIAIYAGTFDPVHTGHITFALQATQASRIDELYFLPERRPRLKQQVEHYGHRVAMIKQATAPYPQFGVLEMTDVNFDIRRTLPQLLQKFPGDQLVFLFGSDVIYGLADWPHVDKLLKTGEFVIGLRGPDESQKIKAIIDKWPQKPPAIVMFKSYAPNVSSGRVREALRRRRPADGLLKSVERYSNHNWLYVSLSD